MAQVKLFGYRGTGGFDDPDYADEPALIKAGHVGMQCDGDARIFGFHPNQAAVETAGSVEDLIVLLQQHVAQPGAVFDDTVVFIRAAELAAQGERTTVWQLPVEMSDEQAARICEALYAAYETQQVFVYNFPFEDGTFNVGEYNCAVFPQHLGIPLPSSDGRLRVFMSAMIAKGATQWTPPFS